MSELVVREDLSKRTALSKSEVMSAYWCQHAAFFDRYYRRPWRPSPDMTFGSAVDAGVEQLIAQLRAYGAVRDLDIPMRAATEVVERDGMEDEVDLGAVRVALANFVDAPSLTDGVKHQPVAERFDWSNAITQHAINVEVDGWGPVNTHPDIILPDSILDVKTSGKQKNAGDLRESPELAFYAIAREVETGVPVAEVGYLAWVRVKLPYWQVITVPVDAELLRRSRAHVDAYVRARKANDALNARLEQPVNWALPGGPRWAGKCGDCAHNPANGGPCPLASQEVPHELAA